MVLRRLTLALFAGAAAAASTVAFTGGTAHAAPAGDLAGATVTLRAQINGKYVTAESGGAAPLIANRPAAGAWEQFTLLANGDGTVSFRAAVNGRYVSADNAGASPLIANRTVIGAWEKFTVITNPDGTTSLRAAANGRIVTAESAGAASLVANRPGVGSWEEFTLTGNPVAPVPPAGRPAPAPVAANPLLGKLVTIRARINGRYVSADNAGASPLIANRAVAGTWEQYTVVDNGDGTVALRAMADNRYVTSDQAAAARLIANRPAVGAWERFTLVDNRDGSYALRAGINSKYVSAESAGAAPLLANRPAAGAWESFELAPVGQAVVEPNGSMTTAQFIAAVATGAQDSQRFYRVPAAVTIAQAILESGWGKSALAYYDKNYFGMKCSTQGSYANGCRSHATSECAPTGACFATTASFRTYATVANSFADHGSMLATNARYAPAFTYVTNPDQFAVQIQRGGYATDPDYAAKLTAVMVKYNLYRYDLAA